jgi:hypothetical protein
MSLKNSVETNLLALSTVIDRRNLGWAERVVIFVVVGVVGVLFSCLKVE